MTGLTADVTYAWRSLWRRPATTLFAVVLLGLAIGASTLLVSYIDAVFLRAVPYPDAERLVSASSADRQGRNRAVSAETVLFWRETGVFEAVEGDRWAIQTLTGIGRPESLQGSYVSEGLFPMLGIRASVGRTFAAPDFAFDAPPVIVVSHKFWSTRLGADRNVLGRVIHVDGRSHVLIGVLPPQAYTPTGGEHFYYLPLRLQQDDGGRVAGLGVSVNVFAKLRLGSRPEQVQGDIQKRTQEFLREQGSTMADWGVDLAPVRERITGSRGSSLQALAAANLCVFLLACGNVAHMLLASAAARVPEYAMQAALGASKRRLFRRALIESGLIGISATVSGLALALVGIQFLRDHPEFFGTTMYQPPQLNAIVCASAVAFGLATVVIAGIVPALRAARSSFSHALAGGRTATAPGRTGNWLVASETCLTTMTVAAAVLLFGSFWRLQQVDLGFEARHVLTAGLPIPEFKYDPAEQAAVYPILLDRLRAIPGAENVALVAPVPFGPVEATVTLDPEGVEKLPDEQPRLAFLHVVTPEYFRVMSIPLRLGRPFGPEDVSNAPGVAIVNETLARNMWGSENPIGKRFAGGEDDSRITVVGVVGDVKDRHFGAQPRSEMYRPLSQWPAAGRAASIMLRASGDPSRLAAELRAAVQDIDPDMPVMDVRTVRSNVEDALRPRLRFLAMAEIFAAASLLLAAAGVYAAISYSARLRTQEIGVRLALGLTRSGVRYLIFRGALTWSLSGAGAGSALSLGLLDLLRNQLFGVSGYEPWVYAVALGTVALTTVVAALPAALWASRLDPVTALRQAR